MRASFILACALLATACGSDATTGKSVRLATELVSDAEIAKPFATETGWTVALDQAAISVGALYYFDGEPAFVRREVASFERFAALLGTPKARAHPGHYVAGSALGQMLSPYAADLLAGPSGLPEGNGVTGTYRSAALAFAAPSVGPAVAALHDDVAMARGVATKGALTVHFRVSASLADVARSAADGKVSGAEFEETEVTGDGKVTVTVVPHVWFNLVDFAEVEPGSAEAPTEVAAESTAHIAFALGVSQLSAYHFTFAEQ